MQEPDRAAIKKDVSDKYGGLTTFEKGDLLLNDKDALVIYSDGACTNNGNAKDGARAGVGVYGGEAIVISMRNPEKDNPAGETNNFAEVHAANEALKAAYAMKATAVELRTDSLYVVNAVTKWSKGWKAKARKNNGRWVGTKGKRIVHQKIFESILGYMKEMDVELKHVKGHSGEDYGNERADELAKEEIWL